MLNVIFRIFPELDNTFMSVIVYVVIGELIVACADHLNATAHTDAVAWFGIMHLLGVAMYHPLTQMFAAMSALSWLSLAVHGTLVLTSLYYTLCTCTMFNHWQTLAPDYIPVARTI